MHVARRLHIAAQRYLGSLGGRNASRLVLALYFKAVLGIQRIFHFDSIDDPGIALLMGGKKVASRSRLGALIRKVSLRGVRRFMRATAPRLAGAVCHWISIDEHAIARFTRKFRISKGYHTIRNKKMKVEKLTFTFDIATRKLYSVVASAGKTSLAILAKKLLPSLRRRARGAPLRVILDAGAAKNYGELLDVALRENQVTIVRTRRLKSYRKAWQELPDTAWTHMEEPGPYTGAAPKKLAIAETRTTLRERAVEVRTVVIREAAGRGKERWHALWVFGDEHTPAYDLVREFRMRQHHEQTYRVMLHDLYIDAAPSGYNKQSCPRRPGFRQNALMLYGWVVALAVNSLLSFTALLPESFHRAHPRTLRRRFFATPAALFLGRDTLIVMLTPKRLRPVWQSLIEHANRRNTRIPWLDNRRLVLSLDTPKTRSNPEERLDPPTPARSIWC
jgi:hypothetical protein